MTAYLVWWDVEVFYDKQCHFVEIFERKLCTKQIVYFVCKTATATERRVSANVLSSPVITWRQQKPCVLSRCRYPLRWMGCPLCTWPVGLSLVALNHPLMCGELTSQLVFLCSPDTSEWPLETDTWVRGNYSTTGCLPLQQLLNNCDINQAA